MLFCYHVCGLLLQIYVYISFVLPWKSFSFFLEWSCALILLCGLPQKQNPVARGIVANQPSLMAFRCTRRDSGWVLGKNFSEREVMCWHRLPRNVMGSPPLEVFQNCGDVALANVVTGHGGDVLVISRYFNGLFQH